ncbi:hypothetical protein NDU88_001149 [Pleurodeles waltl]|uniref:Uncharacterized protein n=1 Tax=Pleurodeles waltl TaxID=8319 RepID=A0AAV7L8V6_PLEWA|nr:hypothetical protein NDU88_001149 [Pleurodeles waltl]
MPIHTSSQSHESFLYVAHSAYLTERAQSIGTPRRARATPDDRSTPYTVFPFSVLLFLTRVMYPGSRDHTPSFPQPASVDQLLRGRSAFPEDYFRVRGLQEKTDYAQKGGNAAETENPCEAPETETTETDRSKTSCGPTEPELLPTAERR